MRGALRTSTTVLLALLVVASRSSEQVRLGEASDERLKWTTFPHPIKKVAVVGAGPGGLQSAAALIREGFEVHLIERQDAPGGNWYHNTLVPIRESYPNDPIHIAAFVPDPRANETRYYEDSDDGLTLEERWREHSRPSPLWDDLTTNSGPMFTSLPETSYPEDAPWELTYQLVQRHVRSYASAQGINSNDVPFDPSAVKLRYSTRLELLEKDGHQWKLSLRQYLRLPHSSQIRAEWTQEYFDAVVIATGGYDTAFVPPTRGLIGWSKVEKDGHYPVHHSQSYRNPELYVNKTVLIVGASVSASEISRRLGPHVEKLYISLRNTTRNTYMARRSIRRLSPFAEHLPEVIEYGQLGASDSIKSGQIKLLNGSWLSGIDEIILSTGFQRSVPFLRDYYKKPGSHLSDLGQSPIASNGHSLTSLSWTGHYIPDPTLAFTNVRPWTLGRYQSLAFAKVWKGTARIPNEEKLWDEYFNDNHWQGSAPIAFGRLEEETLGRQYVAWLNHESLIHGGRLVDQWPLAWREHFVYYADQAWEQGYTSRDNYTRYENIPRNEWPTYPHALDAEALATEDMVESLSEW